MKHYQGSELPELLLSFGKNRIEHVLHLWRSRLCETQSETHQQISHYLNNILEMWNDLEPEGESSIWAAHKTRFTRGNIPNVTLNDKFSIFLDQVTEVREDSLTWDYDDTNTSQQRNENPSPEDHTQQQSNIPHGGFRRIPAFVNHLPSVGGRANVALQHVDSVHDFMGICHIQDDAEIMVSFVLCNQQKCVICLFSFDLHNKESCCRV